MADSWYFKKYQLRTTYGRLSGYSHEANLKQRQSANILHRSLISISYINDVRSFSFNNPHLNELKISYILIHLRLMISKMSALYLNLFQNIDTNRRLKIRKNDKIDDSIFQLSISRHFPAIKYPLLHLCELLYISPLCG